MARARIDWRQDALYDVRSSGPTRSWVDGTASRMAAAAGPGFEWSSQQGRRNPQGRWRAIVYPASSSARRRSARDNVLVRVMGSVRA
ncbi:hypothetical protein [Rhodococcus rhodnii]|uniref:hypothetical protein n=1 Tax=Rhodococcus rhodnii TaxID=38312 RepID=UPI000AB84DD4|nr:hypothetical protein [Rhodococcus rhodnii]